ncbi:MAG TPA: lyase family protein, partial [Naasia sp.]
MTDPLDVGLLDAASGSAADIVGDEAYVAAMVDAERALLAALALVGAAPADAANALQSVPDAGALAAESRGGGNPVIPLIAALRAGAPAEARDAIHLGATSQDILDTAAMLVASRVVAELGALLPPVVQGLAALADEHRGTAVAGRTLGQQAAPTTLGLRFAVLLDGVLRAWRRLESLPLPAQLGGSVGTLAVLVDVLGPERAEQVRDAYAANLGLGYRAVPWHVERAPIAELGSALAILIGALGRIGLEVSQGTRAEIGELDLAIAEGEGGSSAMPQKKNPVAA